MNQIDKDCGDSVKKPEKKGFDGEHIVYPPKPQKSDYRSDKEYMRAVVDWKIEMNQIRMEELGL